MLLRVCQSWSIFIHNLQSLNDYMDHSFDLAKGTSFHTSSFNKKPYYWPQKIYTIDTFWCAKHFSRILPGGCFWANFQFGRIFKIWANSVFKITHFLQLFPNWAFCVNLEFFRPISAFGLFEPILKYSLFEQIFQMSILPNF